MKKLVFATLFFAGISTVASAQVKEGIDRAVKSPDRKANEAKADLRLHDKTVLSDTTGQVKAVKRKKRSCPSKRTS